MHYSNDIKYCFDTSAFITLHRFYPDSLIHGLWQSLEELFDAGRIISHEIVFNEIVPKTGNKDSLAIWIEKYKTHFLSRTQYQVNLLPDILRNFPKLIDPEHEKEQADPWLLAMIIENMENEGIFGIHSQHVLVTTESKKSTTKLPAACKYYSIRHMDLFEFFESNGFKFIIEKAT